ncbi:hypothetical protein FRB95_003076 [Tulasnella sp. JGI-2019a]|nr:hypothetical protein FRB95_003076 [Tulasnella sp. JGI-2019a]
MLDISSPPPLEDLEFQGRPNEDVSRFLGAVMRAALIQGRHLDREWMFAYTESCLRGDAMEWFDNMSADIARMDWSSLRKWQRNQQWQWRRKRYRKQRQP